MDFIAEIVMEMLGTAIIDGGVDAASDHRRPMWQRVLILSLVVLFFTAVFVLMTAAGVIMLTGGRPVAGVLMFALDLALIFFCVHKFRNILRTFSRK